MVSFVYVSLSYAKTFNVYYQEKGNRGMSIYSRLGRLG